jgi:hypothetical protein
MRLVLTLPLGLVAVALAAAPAGAQDPPPERSLDLDLVITPGVRHCPPEERLHREVSRRLGYDPFIPDGSRTPVGRLRVRIAADGNGLVATYAWINPDGKPRWPKPKIFDEEGTDEITCTDLYKGIAIGVIWEFPRGPHRVQPAPVQAVPVPVCAPVAAVPECVRVAPAVVVAEPPAKVEPVVVAAAPAPAPRVWSLEAGPWVDFGLAPAPMFGVKIGGAMRVRRWEVAGELRWDPSGSAIVQNGAGFTMGVSTRLLAAGLAGCAYAEWHASFAGCVVGEVGQLQRSLGSSSYNNLQQAAPYAGGGLGVHVALPLPAHLYVQAAADTLVVTKLASGHGLSGGGVNANAGNVAGFAGGTGVALGVAF